jgi:Fe2+ transport system protein B
MLNESPAAQRSADVDILLQNDERLRGQRQQAIDRIDQNRRFLRIDLQHATEELQKAQKDKSADVDQKQKALDEAQQRLKMEDEETKRLENSIADIDAQRKEINNKITHSGSVIEYNSLLIRVVAVFLIMFLVQTFITIFRYSMRLSAYYQARADALALADGAEITISDLQRITSVLSPETYDFGKTPRTPTEQAVDLAKEIIRFQKGPR